MLFRSTPDPERRRYLQSVVVIGGGPSGCELAGSLSALMRSSTGRDFRQLDPEACQVTLVDPGDRLLKAMHPSLSAAAAHSLERTGVRLLLGGRVQRIEPGRLVLTRKTDDGSSEEVVMEAATVCWTAGVRASHLGGLLAERTGCSTDRGGRVIVEPDFSIAGHPEIRVVGDLCSYSHTADGKPLPGMAGPAVQAGGWVARDILARLRGETIPPFRWLDVGTMAVIGPWYAVADLRGLRLSGLAGWLVWALAHLAFIPDTENRIALFSKWMWQIATRQRTALLITGRPDQHLGVDVGLFRAVLERKAEGSEEGLEGERAAA